MTFVLHSDTVTGALSNKKAKHSEYYLSLGIACSNYANATPEVSLV
jgi:hypothetical protein